MSMTRLVCALMLLQENSSSSSSRAPGSPTSLRVPPNGGCEDLDMETEEEDDVRARGQCASHHNHMNMNEGLYKSVSILPY